MNVEPQLTERRVHPPTSEMRPVVFLGPSLRLAEAQAILDADFRPPCRRGDLAALPGGCCVGLIDGVFHQHDAISPREITLALERGITLLGSSSMGALRAAEVPGMIGIGRVYEWYATGFVTRDDEVALIFDAEGFIPRSVPLVNVRYAVERLVASGTILRATGDRILSAAQALHYRDRAYPTILEHAGIPRGAQSIELAALLSALDLKADDARLLLERLPSYRPSTVLAGRNSNAQRPDYGPGDTLGTARSTARDAADGSSLIWEIGGEVPFRELIRFMKLTGSISAHARSALFRHASAGGVLNLQSAPVTEDEIKRRLADLFRTWGWNTNEEARVTLDDLSVGFKELVARLREECLATRIEQALLRDLPDAFLRALRGELLLNDLSLKREVMRERSLASLAESACLQPLGEEDRIAARKAICRAHGGAGWGSVRELLAAQGISAEELAQFVDRVAFARLAAARIAAPIPPVPEERIAKADAEFGLVSARKPSGEARFTLSIQEAHEHALRLKDVIGVTRIAIITELSELSGFHVSQAARPSGVWSSTYGSGKGTTEAGAIVGAVMEETEKWAQEQFKGDPIWATYLELRERAEVLDPQLLDLPYDSEYAPHRPIAWHRCFDLLRGERIYVPLASIACSSHAGKHNAFFSRRGARVTISTNGLASGFSLAEALVHATCEYIERHAVRMMELRLENPGTPRGPLPRRIVLEPQPNFVSQLAGRLASAGCQVDLWDVTSEVRVPTVYARLVKDQELACGWACHPNRSVAMQMALLEAAQTVVAAIAGGREDLIIQARSLGRHERTRPLRAAAQAFWEDPDLETMHASAAGGFSSNDAHAELDWVRTQLRLAGVSHLIAVDLGTPEIAPARVVRVVIPGLETNNPFFTGQRARVALLSDMLPLPNRAL